MQSILLTKVCVAAMNLGKIDEVVHIGPFVEFIFDV